MFLSIRAEKSWDPQQYPEKSPCERLPGRQRQIPSAEPGLWCEPTTPCCHCFYYVIKDRLQGEIISNPGLFEFMKLC